MPDVGVDFSVDEFEFVEVADGSFSVRHCDGFFDLKAVWIEETNAIRAVAENQRLAVGGEPPALAVVLELADLLEGLCVVDKTELLLPRELVNLVVQKGDALGEEWRWDVDFLQYPPGLHVHVAQTGETNLSGAFEHFSVENDEALGKCVRVMRPDVNYLVAEGRHNGVFRCTVARRIGVCISAAVASQRRQRQNQYENQRQSGHIGHFA